MSSKCKFRNPEGINFITFSPHWCAFVTRASINENVPNPENYLIDRGFTGHEHLDAFGLINMNGRIYDPVLGRMLSPDNFVQAPGNSQG